MDKIKLKELQERRKIILKDLQNIDAEIEKLSISEDPIENIVNWMNRPSHKNILTDIPGGIINQWLDEYVWKDAFGDPDGYPKFSTQSLTDHIKALTKGKPILNEYGITTELINQIILEDFDLYTINW